MATSGITKEKLILFALADDVGALTMTCVVMLTIQHTRTHLLPLFKQIHCLRYLYNTKKLMILVDSIAEKWGESMRKNQA